MFTEIITSDGTDAIDGSDDASSITKSSGARTGEPSESTTCTYPIECSAVPVSITDGENSSLKKIFPNSSSCAAIKYKFENISTTINIMKKPIVCLKPVYLIQKFDDRFA